MSSARFRERLLQRAGRTGLALDDATIDQIEAYYRLLQRWNRKINLTALPLETMSDQAIDRVLVEPLVAAEAVETSSISWFDLGSGGGSPALPIKIVKPLTRLTLVEARSRKAAFLREAVRELSLSDVAVIDDRFENLTGRAEFAGCSELVTVRAVRTDAALFDCARWLLRADTDLLLFATTGSSIPPAPGFGLSRTVPLIEGESELIVFRARQ